MQQVIESGYFMSQDEQDAVIGRVVREHKAESSKLALLRAEADRIGNQLSNIGIILASEPHSLIRQGEGVPTELIGPKLRSVNAEDIDFERVMKLTKEIRECLMRIKELDRQKLNLGI